MKESWQVFGGDVADVLPTLEPESFDAALCDPPYGLSFMGKAWDHGVPGEPVWRLVSAALKPGAGLIAFGGTRTFHRLTCAIEDAGFEIRDCLSWLYGSGFPKSLDIAKAIDKAARGFPQGTNRRDPENPNAGKFKTQRTEGKRSELDKGQHFGAGPGQFMAEKSTAREYQVTDSDARLWSGYGTALKPAWEPAILAMKPCAGTFAQNALEHGVAGVNVDGCRIGTTDSYSYPNGHGGCKGGEFHYQKRATTPAESHPAGRWPANVVLSHTDDCREIVATFEQGWDHETGGPRQRVDPETRWECSPECPVRMLDEQSGERRSAGLYPSESWGTGLVVTCGASRFYYCAKASRAEREAGLEGFGDGLPTPTRNHHPTVKPINLCRWLATLLLPPKRDTPRRLLVPFSGSGSEMIGALLAGWDEVVGIELEAEYVAIAKTRLSHWVGVKLNTAPSLFDK